jgi:hypothetical protein
MNTSSQTIKQRVLLAAAASIAETITASRPAFSQFYDGVLASMRRPDLPNSFMQALVLAQRRVEAAQSKGLDPAKDRDAFALALFALGSDHAVANIAMACIAAGLFDRAPEAERLAARQDAAAAVRAAVGWNGAAAMMPPASPSAAPGAQPQRAFGEAIIDPKLTWTSPNALYPGVVLAMRRLCRITTIDANNKQITGTGFLIGPSAVLTNWHVVEAIPADFEDSASVLKIHFDYASPGATSRQTETYEPARDWLMDHSTFGPRAPSRVQESWWMNEAVRGDWQKQLINHLDYAVIKLKGTPGRQRGWYDIGAAARLKATGACWVFHHPGNQGQTITGGSFVFVDGLRPVRAFHSATTMGGSSGGLMLDENGYPVALHHARLGNDEIKRDGSWPVVPQEVLNVAVPLTAIAAKVGDNKLQLILKEGRAGLPRGCLDGGRPLFGRDNLLDTIEELQAGRGRVLWVKPPEPGWRKPGKTFSVNVLKALLPAPANVFVEFSADQVKAGGREMAEFIMKTLGSRLNATLPAPEVGATTETAYFQDHLLPVLRDTIKRDFSSHTVWLVIDDLDIHNLPDAGGRRFLDVLYRRVEDIPQLRIVLIGLKVALPSVAVPTLRLSPIDLVPKDSARPGTEPDFLKLFQDWLRQRTRDLSLPNNVITLLSEMAISHGGKEPSLQTLASFAIDHLDVPLKRLDSGHGEN